MAKVLTELIGTFFLVLVIALCAVNPLAPVAIGCALTGLVYMGGHVSMAHYNPAVTLGFYVRGVTPLAEIAPYIGAQLFGAVGATLIAQQITGGELLRVAPSPAHTMLASVLVEGLFTFLLMLVILNVAVSAGTAGNSHYGLAIGLTVTGIAFAGGAISGGAYNPAVGCGPNLVRAFAGDPMALGRIGLYALAPISGAVAAALVFEVQETHVVANQAAT